MAEAVDKISLKDAVEMPIWEVVYVGAPQREIDVRMTYADLHAICEWIWRTNEGNKGIKPV